MGILAPPSQGMVYIFIWSRISSEIVLVSVLILVPVLVLVLVLVSVLVLVRLSTFPIDYYDGGTVHGVLLLIITQGSTPRTRRFWSC